MRSKNSQFFRIYSFCPCLINRIFTISQCKKCKFIHKFKNNFKSLYFSKFCPYLCLTTSITLTWCEKSHFLVWNCEKCDKERRTYVWIQLVWISNFSCDFQFFSVNFQSFRKILTYGENFHFFQKFKNIDLSCHYALSQV